MGTIFNASSVPINVRTGTVPDVSDALSDFYQPLIFEQVIKTTTAFQVVETTTPILFRGLVQPLKARDLLLKPQGQRAWTWLWVHCDLALQLNVDDVGIFLGMQTRVMARTDNSTYGFMEYQWVQDYSGSGPAVGP